LNSLVIKAKYKVPITDWNKIITEIQNEVFLDWISIIHKNIAEFYNLPKMGKEYQKINKLAILGKLDKLTEEVQKYRDKMLKKLRKGFPFVFQLMIEQRLSDALILDVECKPVLYFLITVFRERKFYEQGIQEAQIECVRLIETTMKGVLGAQEIMPPTIGPFIKRTEIKNKLLDLGLTKAVEALDVAEQHTIQHKFPDALGRCREALEKTCEWGICKCGLEKTDSFAHNIDRLNSKGFLDEDTAVMLKKCYSYLARVGTPHEKGAEPGLLEARLSLNMTLTILEYLTSRFG
jgi:hypothetical protein